ncbi:uncharacterized protein UTRI_00090 [Ustilago trichophora]|uniref:Uncharacterized protein n=1 Tax=Ustilago trichophora TaxID=86804 RepID=A0A5C3DQI8_9BASI|nr:uncharacterized protein UTRI_00090 [Ustilago trichophora]
MLGLPERLCLCLCLCLSHFPAEQGLTIPSFTVSPFWNRVTAESIHANCDETLQNECADQQLGSNETWQGEKSDQHAWIPANLPSPGLCRRQPSDGGWSPIFLQLCKRPRSSILPPDRHRDTLTRMLRLRDDWFLLLKAEHPYLPSQSSIDSSRRVFLPPCRTTPRKEG